ncbi:Uncharacterized protein dnl_16570 [Desulfonema limicola]|uniref:Uncharacterized protein n=1 Tax=Desulfonema limicola TaxID=45656 RepID=A0A975B5Z6_9BACT|nr:hypothetical protein [Desulfonema limicola]QTA79389.1 Uncharacterized protein dnl_16570 [Desulfonema limicola]
MNRFLTNKIYFLILFIILPLWGCSTVPDMVSTEKKKGENYSADDVRYLTIDQPFMASGDYFRERKQDTVIDPAGLFSKSQAKKTCTAPKKEPVPFPLKTGVIINRDNINADTASLIYESIVQSAKELPVIIAESDMVEEAIAQIKCPNKKDLNCISESLGVYPGIRLMIMVEKYIIPAQFPGILTAITGFADSGVGFIYPFMEIKVPVNAKSDLDLIMPGIMRNILDYAIPKTHIMPWFCRTFSHENNEWYITSGRDSGLKQGDLLKVVSGGKLIKNPAGMPAGWVPGIEKGVVKVHQLFSKDFAVCTLETGKGPDKEDILVYDSH